MTSMARRLEKEKSRLCLECMKCCKFIKVRLTEFPTKRTRELYEAKKVKIYYEKETGLYFLLIPYRCPQLTPHGCAIYENRPQACKDYDGRLDPAVDCKWKELDFDFGEEKNDKENKEKR